MPMYCCHSDVITCAYKVGEWVRNPEIFAYVINEWPLSMFSELRATIPMTPHKPQPYPVTNLSKYMKHTDKTTHIHE